MSDTEVDYYIHRAETEIELAQRAEHPKAVAAHYQLAEFYLDRVYGDGPGEEGAPDYRVN